MPVDTHEDIQPAASLEPSNAVETHEDIRPAMGVTSARMTDTPEFKKWFSGSKEIGRAHV